MTIQEKFRDFFFSKYKDAEEPLISIIYDFAEENELTDEKIVDIIKKDKAIFEIVRLDSERNHILRAKKGISLVDVEDVF